MVGNAGRRVSCRSRATNKKSNMNLEYIPVPKPLHCLLIATALLGSASPSAEATDVADQVVASIKPVHSLVSGVMAGVGEPHLIIRDTTSPHAFSLRPSDAASLENAQVVFLVGKSIETSLVNSVNTLARHARVVLLSEAHGLVHRPLRQGGAFEAHAHDADEDHGHHEEEGHSDGERHHDHEADGHHEHHGDEGDDTLDLHFWLDPVNAGAMVRTISDVLSEADPVNAGAYAANAEMLLRRLEDLTAEVAAELAPARDRPFIVFHDAYQHFEDRFGLKAVGSVMVSPDQTPSVRRITELRDKVHRLGAICVFAEIQFEPNLVDTITEGTSARTGTLDPLSAAESNGPEAYFDLIRNMAASFKQCLVPVDQD